MRLIFYIIFSLLLYDFGLSQQAYTSSQYAVRAEYDIPYQTAVDYAGNTINLKLDLYKPVGDNNCKRPIIVFTHGGSWIGGDRKQASFINVARGMAGLLLQSNIDSVHTNAVTIHHMYYVRLNMDACITMILQKYSGRITEECRI